MARPNEWSIRVQALLKAGNPDAAMAQIKVAPDVKDLKALQAALLQAGLTGRWRNVDACIADSLAALSKPRLHRSP
jgi:hypothetical protein